MRKMPPTESLLNRLTSAGFGLLCLTSATLVFNSAVRSAVEAAVTAATTPTATPTSTPTVTPTPTPSPTPNPCQTNPYGSACGSLFETNPAVSFPGTQPLNLSGTVSIAAAVGRVSGNQPPIAYPQNLQTQPNVAAPASQNGMQAMAAVPLSIQLAGADQEGRPLQYAIQVAPIHGALSGTAPDLIYTPNEGFVGQDAFVFTVADGARFGAAVVTIRVGTREDNPPSIAVSTPAIAFNQTVSISVSATDDGGAPTVSILSPTLRGVLTGSAPTLTYNSNGNWGRDHFFVIADETGVDPQRSIMVVHLMVADPPVNAGLFNGDPDAGGAQIGSPVAGYGSQSFENIDTTVFPDGAHIFFIKATDDGNRVAKTSAQFQVDNTPPTIAFEQRPVATTVSGMLAFRLGATDNVRVSSVRAEVLKDLVVQRTEFLTTSPYSFNFDSTTLLDGDYEFRFVALDMSANVSATPVAASYRIDNAAPAAVIRINGTVVSPSQTQTVNGSVALNITATDAVSGVAGIELRIDGTLAATSLTSPLAYTWNTQSLANGAHALSITLRDQINNIAVVSMPNINVQNNNAPQAFGQVLTTLEDTATGFTLRGADLENNPLTFSLLTSPAHGTLSGTGATRSYLPAAHWSGTDSFTFKVNDGAADSLPATVTINVTPVNDAPVLTGLVDRTAFEGVELRINTISSSDVDGPAQTRTYRLEAGAPAGAQINSTTAELTWTPGETDGGTQPLITVTVTDNGTPPLSATGSFRVTVTETNQAPTLSVIANQTINEGASLNITAVGADADIPAQALTYTLVAAPIGMAINAASGLITWTTNESHGSLTPHPVTVRVTDSASAFAERSFTVTVNEVNQSPTLNVILNQTINEGATMSVTAVGSDADVPAQTLTYSLPTAPSGMTINSSGVITWATNESHGSITPYNVTVRVTDSAAAFAERSFTVTVNETNQAPTLNAIANQTLNEGATLSLTAVGADADVPAQTLTYSLPTAPSGMTINSSGVITWATNESHGSITPYNVTVRVTDSAAAFAERSFTVTVNETNQAPVLTPIGNKSVVERTLLSFTVTAADPDVPVQALTFSLDAGAPAGAAINGASGLFTWTPAENQGPASHSLTIRVTDNGTPALSRSETLTIFVGGANLTPVLSPIGNKSVAEGATLSFTASASDGDIPADTLSFSLVGTVPSGATINSVSGLFTWTPIEAQGPGTYPVTIRVTDNGSPIASAQETISIAVTEVNQSPTLNAIANQTLNEGATLSLTAVGADADVPAQTLTYSLLTAPAGMTINSAGVITWVTNESHGSLTPYSVTVRVTDSLGGTAERSFNVTVNEVNVAPVLAAIGNKTITEGAQLIFTASATDADGNTVTYTMDAGAPAGAAIHAATGLFTWTPTEAQGPGVYAITIRATDNGAPALADFETITVTVDESNLPPIARVAAAPAAVEERTLVEGALDGSASSDPDNDPLTYVWTQVSGPSVTLINRTSARPSFMAPEVTATTTLGFELVVNDGLVNSEKATVTVSVLNVNRAPTAFDQPNVVTNEDTDKLITLTGTDPETPAQNLVYVIVTGPQHGTLLGTAPNLTYRPEADYNSSIAGLDSFTFTVSDGQLTSAAGTVAINIVAVNDAPSVPNLDLTVSNSSTLTLSLSGTDPESNSLIYSLVSSPANGTASIANGQLTYTPNSNFVGMDTLTYRAHDGGLYSNTGTVRVTVTNGQAPSVQIVSPADNQTVTGIVPITLALTNEDISRVTIWVDNVVQLSRTTPPFDYSLNTRTLVNGDHQIRVDVVGANGMVTSLTRTISVNNVNTPAPTVRIISPANVTSVGRDISIIVEAIGAVDRLEADINGVPYPMTSLGSNRYGYTWNTRTLPDGGHAIGVKAFSPDQTVTVAAVNVFVDNTAPVVAFTPTTLERLARGAFGNQSFVVNATDNDSIASVNYWFGLQNISVQPGTSQSEYQYVLDTRAYPDDDGYSIFAVARDAAGNETATPLVFFEINNANPPRSSLRINEHPRDGAFVVSAEEAQITVSFNEQIDVTSVNKDSIKVRAFKDGVTKDVPGEAVYQNGVISFNGAIPWNADVTWSLVSVRDADDQLLDGQFRFKRAMSKALGGEVVHENSYGRFRIIVPPNSLKEDMQVVIEIANPEQVSSIREANQRAQDVNDGHRYLAGPFATYGLNAAGVRVEELSAPVTIAYTDLAPPAAAEEQARVVQIQGLEGVLWRPLGTSGRGQSRADVDPIGTRRVSVPVSKFSTFRVTSLAVPGAGVGDVFNFPNPFSPSERVTTLHYMLGSDARVTLVIYDLFGNLVKRMEFSPGFNGGKVAQNFVDWDGRNGAGEVVGNGGYIVQIHAEDADGNKSKTTHKIGVVK